MSPGIQRQEPSLAVAGAQPIPALPWACLGPPGGISAPLVLHHSALRDAGSPPPALLPGQAGAGKASPAAQELQEACPLWATPSRLSTVAGSQSISSRASAGCRRLQRASLRWISRAPGEGRTWTRCLGLPGKHQQTHRESFGFESKSQADDGSKLNLPTAFLRCRAVCFLVDPVSQKDLPVPGNSAASARDGGEVSFVLFCFVFSAAVTKAFQEFVGTGGELRVPVPSWVSSTPTAVIIPQFITNITPEQ